MNSDLASTVCYQPIDHRRIEPMFLNLHAIAQGCFIVIGEHRHGDLIEDVAAVHAFVHHVNGAPVTETPAARTSRCACAPGKAGNSEG